ncbi:ABC transporter ATP-binding protein [Sporichthya polymorpha]|uniref:ABC transporter ATP-binding protein n=1 Tax=Sporichthya polymorpha TaxID=35751 RepID=UPI00039C543F|nr:ABC transporter ATP-binding protein [Sporichthya polymorpha]
MLELRNITAGYDTGTVLRDVSLVVPDNATVALLGPNGAGKTTLLRVASGLLKPYSGHIVIDGRDVTSYAPYKMARQGIIHVPEGRGIFPSLTVGDNLLLQSPPGEFRKAFATATGTFPRLGERARQIAGTMSGGEQQMLALAHAYVGNPRVVLLDEVSMGLAPKIVEEIFDYLTDLGRQGIAQLLVEQYVGQALKMADYVYILDRGRISFAGEPAEISEETIMNSYLGSLAS